MIDLDTSLNCGLSASVRRGVPPLNPKAVAVLLAAMLLSVTAARAEKLGDAKFGFTLEIPDGFRADSASLGTNPDNLYVFRKDEPGKGVLAIVIQRRHGVLSR